MSDKTNRPPPRQNLIRAVMPGTEVRDGDGSGAPTLFGHFAKFDEPTEINSAFEGHFIERIAPGAFRKTFRERRDQIKVLFQHGMDPQVGDKPIAKIDDLREDENGAYYEASVFRGLPDLVMDGLRAGQYGASFRFSVVRESWNDRPAASDSNPNGLRERTIKEAAVPEFGPVTFPAYSGASAGVRSLTDEFLLLAIEQDPDHIRSLVDEIKPVAVAVQPPTPIVVNTLAPGDPETARMVAEATTTDPDLALIEDEPDDPDPTLTTDVDALRLDDPDEPDPAAPDVPEPTLVDDETERRDGEQDAPSEDDAEPDDQAHLADERRDDNGPQSRTPPRRLPVKRTPIYGTRRKETSKPWLLGPSRNTSRS